MAKNISQERAPHVPWSIKEVDGLLFVKINGERAKTKTKHLTEQILGVSAHKNGKDISITMKDMLAVGGKATMVFDIGDFNALNGPLSSPNCKGQEFESSWKRWKITKENGIIESSQEPRLPLVQDTEGNESDDDDSATQTPKTPSKMKARKRNTDEVELDLLSPGKKLKRATTVDQEISTHHIGLFRLEVARLDNPPDKWLDRPLDEDHVARLVACMQEEPFSFTRDQQPWVAIADIAREDLAENRHLIKGCKTTVIGGLHRKAAMEKVCSTSEKHREIFKYVFVSLYANTMTDEQVKRVAANHNTNSKASKTTTWVERVEACRNWRYHMDGLPTNGPTPPSTMEWRESCKRMYVESGKSPISLEPTLQAALLEKQAWDLFSTIARKHSKGELKDQQKKTKPSRMRKKQEITQNQLGMPLQGISLRSKITLLKAVANEELSLKEMATKATNIKSKRNIIDAFLKHTGVDTWEELKEQFPEHTKEEQISQFVHLRFRPKNVPQELKDFFQRAVTYRERQKEGRRKGKSMTEMAGLYVFSNGEAVAAKGSTKAPGIVEVRSAFPEPIDGFELVIARVPKGLAPEDLKIFLINIHSVNIERMNHYNVVLLIEDDMFDQKPLEKVLREKMIPDGIQQLFWNNTSRRALKGRKMPNQLSSILVGHWTNSGSLTTGSCHFDPNETVTNVLSCEAEAEGQYPYALLKFVLSHFSYPEAWVYGLNITPGPFVRACMEAKRKCVCASDDPRMDSRLIQKALLRPETTVVDQEEEGEEEYDTDMTMDEETVDDA